MAGAFLLINVGLSSEDQVVDALRGIANVKEAYATYGAYDVVARVEAESLEKLKEIVTTRIRRVPNVRATLTTVIADES